MPGKGRPFDGIPGPGRPKGPPPVPIHKAKDIAECFAKILESDEYQDSLRKRLVEGKAPHMETLAHFYAYKKPREQVLIEGGDRPVPLVIDAIRTTARLLTS